MTRKFTLILAAFLIAAASPHAQIKQGVNLQELGQLTITNNAQPGTIPGVNPDKCGFVYTMNQARNNGFNDARYEQELGLLINQRRQMNNFLPPSVIYTIPVIFHISYDGNTESSTGTGANISQLQINAQIEQLNRDFADLSGSVYGVAEDMGVRFVAARVDPSGNLLCEPGIERINWRSRTGWLDPSTLGSTSSVSNHYSTIVKPQSIWNPYQYLNIWLGNFSASGLLGYATFPGLSTLPGLNDAETDLTAGIVVLSGTVGSQILPGTAIPYHTGRTMTHELGHFFGLRHITGDASCGDDYCGDTPPQSALTSGCPAAGTLNNCTPSVPKMFENYMDYSSDACLNTFTLNQSERCQVVMLNSPRRKELATSTKGNSPMPNRVFFKAGATIVSESATGACPRYKDYIITIGVDVSANANATVSLTKSGTATENVDYLILEPSVNYTNADAANKTFTLRVFDDAMIEGNETAILGLNISGTGVQTSVSCPTQYTVTITDDDFVLAINDNSPLTTLLSENFGTVAGSNQVPVGWTISGSSVNKWVGNSTGGAAYGFTGNTMHISDANATDVSAGIAPINYSINDQTDARLITPALNAAGLKNIAVSFNFVSNGEADADGVYDLGVVYYSLDGINYSIARDISNNYILQGVTTLTAKTLYLPATQVGTNSLRFLFRFISDNNTGEQPPFTIDDVLITGQAVTVESQRNSNATEIVSSGSASSYFYSTADGQIITRLENSSANLGCVTANVQAQGFSNTPLITTGGVFTRHLKVISINPLPANTTASYRATFYFTTTELIDWNSNVANLKLMKVNTGVNLSGTLTAAEYQVVPTVVNDLRTTNGYASFTGDFTGGFSQFLLVLPAAPVPVTLLSFQAQAGTKNILLSWKTASEINNKGFVIERSTNGSDFEKIGWLDGKVNSSTTTSYSYTDNFVQPGILYYYRLRQTDLDGKETLSEIRQAKIKGQSMVISVSPNPATDILKVFTGGYTGASQIRLLNAKGQVLQSWRNLNTSASPQLLDISRIPAGVYMLQVQTTQSVLAEKIIIQ